MMQLVNTNSAPLPPLSQRDEIARQILGRFQDKRVLVIGIGGGGDVVSTLPTCFDLERLGATTIPAGLTWKRMVHDPYGRPRPIEHFENCSVFNNLVAEANPQTRTYDGITHIEARVSAALDNRPIVMLDITPGSAALGNALTDYCSKRSIDAIIGVDAGGDVLCAGHEPTLESPICDQILLATLCKMPSSLLGVFGFGADGEMPLTDLRPRFATLHAAQAYMGALTIDPGDIPRMVTILKDAPTEASRAPIALAQELAPERFHQVLDSLNRPTPDLAYAIGVERSLPMRSGFRTANLSDLTAATMFFDPRTVFSTSKFAELWREAAGIDEIAEVLHAAGITTEFREKERTATTNGSQG